LVIYTFCFQVESPCKTDGRTEEWADRTRREKIMAIG